MPLCNSLLSAIYFHSQLWYELLETHSSLETGNVVSTLLRKLGPKGEDSEQ